MDLRYGHLRAVLMLMFFLKALATQPPTWNQAHTVKGTLYIPYAEIEEPFEAWCDGHANRSRIDYYDSTVKTYQLSKECEFGASIKIAPVTTNDELNEMTCLKENGTSKDRVRPQSTLPDCENFEFTATEDLGGWKCDKFVHEKTSDEKVNRYTLWVRYEESSGEPIPVRYETRGYSELLGYYDHFHIDYHSYTHHGNISDDIFKFKLNKPCIDITEPEDGRSNHHATMNPMKEFIHPTDSSHIADEHGRFMKKHGIEYETNEERMHRENVFMHNLRFIHSKNREQLGFSLGVNHLTDRTINELKALSGHLPSSGVYNGGMPFPYELDNETLAELPESHDWRLFGAVTPVKDQAVCGSCWSFGTTGAVEGALFVHNGGHLVRLSEQALMDCSWGYQNFACDGGDDFRAYAWIKKMGGIPTDASYGGYRGQEGFCHVNYPNVTLVAPITGWVNVTRGDVNAMKVALIKHGPISVSIDASHRAFNFYSHGVHYEPKCGSTEDDLTHNVLVVGYGSMKGEPYWLVKNSFSNLWGNDGYILMSARDNNCGILTSPTYVTF